MGPEVVLSFCIPTFNQKELLCKGIQGLLKYPYNDIEIIVCDNASTDGTWKELEKINDLRFKAYRNKKNMGFWVNMMRSLMLANGKYRIILKDRNYIKVEEIVRFVEFIKDKNYEMILALEENYKNISMQSIEEKAYILYEYSDPGNLVYSEQILDRVKLKYSKCVQDMEELQKNSLYIWQYLWSCMVYSESWYGYFKTRLSYNIAGENISKVKQNRNDVDSPKLYFTPLEGVFEIAKIYMDNGAINKTDREEYISGIYKDCMKRILWDFDAICHNKYECMRYSYIPDKFICYFLILTKYINKTIKWLKEKNLYSVRLFIKILKTSIYNYGRFVLFKLEKYK